MNKLRLFQLISLVCLAGCSTLPAAQRISSSETSHSYVLNGSGAPVVILEAGLGGGKEAWAPVYDQLSQISRVFAYDRAGYGTSHSRNWSRDGATAVRELRSTLRALRLEPPYVLVGHSLGGTYMELYARTYPDEVAGVVLVDSRHADFTRQCLAANAKSCEPPLIALALMPDTPRKEMTKGDRTMQQVIRAGPFPDVPLAVLTSGKQALTGTAFGNAWLETQESLAAMSSKSVHEICGNCGHFIQRDNPDLVVDAVRNIVRAVRAEKDDEWSSESEEGVVEAL